jgi:hypothetical protein
MIISHSVVFITNISYIVFNFDVCLIVLHSRKSHTGIRVVLFLTILTARTPLIPTMLGLGNLKPNDMRQLGPSF